MSEPTLQEIFGANATQSATTITIDKANLTGLVASATNRAESLFAALIATAATNMTTTARESNPDRSIAIENGFDRIVYRGSPQVAYAETSRTVTFHKLNPAAGISPMDY